MEKKGKKEQERDIKVIIKDLMLKQIRIIILYNLFIILFQTIYNQEF